MNHCILCNGGKRTGPSEPMVDLWKSRPIPPLVGASRGVDLLYMGPYDYTYPNHMDILCRILVYFGSAVGGVFFHLIPDEDTAFVVKDCCVLKVVVDLLVELE